MNLWLLKAYGEEGRWPLSSDQAFYKPIEDSCRFNDEFKLYLRNLRS